jgi:aarF domain-containing kinase
MLLIGSPGSGESTRRRNGWKLGRKLKRRRSRLVQGEGVRWGAVWWYDFMVRQMQKAGPTFIKVIFFLESFPVALVNPHVVLQLAQWAASRADLFPEMMCDKMGMLHSNGKPHSLTHTRQVVEAIFRRPFSEVFEEFEENPIGIGAIAQVYRLTTVGSSD